MIQHPFSALYGHKADDQRRVNVAKLGRAVGSVMFIALALGGCDPYTPPWTLNFAPGETPDEAWIPQPEL